MTLVVFLASVPGLMPVLYGATAASTEPPATEPSAFQATPQQKAADYLKGQIAEISEALLSDFPKDLPLVITAVSFHRLCKDYYKAIRVCEQASRNIPNHSGVHQNTADIYFRNGEYEKALVYWRKASAISPENLNVQDNIADCLIHLGRYPEAAELLEEKTKAAPHSARSYFLLGQAYIQLGDLNNAKACYKEALELNPGLPDGNYWLARVCIRLKQPDEAKRYMQAHKAIKATEEEQRRAWTESRGAHVGQNSSNKEIEEFPQMLTKLSVRGYKLYQIQNSTDQSERLFKKTEAAFEKTIAIDSQQQTVFQQFASFYLGSEQKLDKAQENVKKAIALKETAESYYILGLIYEKMDHYKEALTAFEKAVKLKPKNNTYKVKFNELFEKTL